MLATSSVIRRIGHDSVWARLGSARHLRLVYVARPKDMKYGLSCGDQVVRDNSPMAAPPDRLGTHDGASPRPPAFAQGSQAGLEGFGHGVVGIVVKALVLPECVHGRWRAVLFSPQASERGNVLVPDLAFG